MDDLKNWFHRTGHPYFTLYYGHNNNGKSGQRFYNNSEVSDLDEAWEHVAEVLEPYDQGHGGRFTVFVSERTGGGNGYKVNLTLQGAKSGAMASINGTGGAGLPPGVGSVKEYVDDKVRSALEIQDLKARLRMAEGANAGTFWDRIGEAVIESEMAPVIVDKTIDLIGDVLGSRKVNSDRARMNGTPKKTRISTQGFDNPPEEGAVPETDLPDEEDTVDVDWQVVAPQLERIYNATGIHPHDLMEVLADISEEKPMMVQMLFNQQKKK